MTKTLVKKKPNIVCIQETKMEMINDKVLKEIDHEFSLKGVFSGSRGLSGGLLILWDSSIFCLLNCEINESWIGVSLINFLINQKFIVVNVYSPQSLRDKKFLWESLTSVISHGTSENLPLLFIGDFNCIRSLGDINANGDFDRVTRMAFNNWILDNNLVEIQLNNAVFTWIGP